MPSRRCRCILAIALLALPAAAQRPTLTVHCDRPLHAVDKRLFGIFFEEINHAGDGGLYGELLRNRNLEEPGEPIPGWSLQLGPDAKATMARDRERPCQPAAPTALRLSIEQGAASVVAHGHFGVPLRQGDSYLLRFDARADASLQRQLTITFDTDDGDVVGSATVGPIGSDWRRFEIALGSERDVAAAALSITAHGPGTLWLDTVSLFPTATFRDQRLGMRRDLGQLLARLQPAFVRFPGGCFVEGGDRLADAFRWQQTIGDIADRPGHANANWGYWSSDGLGYHEYLQLCEDLQAEPLFVVNCGMSHKELVPLDQLQPWIDEALDAIDYANGAVTTKWGAVRAANGHPAPFGLRLLEIGNENGMFASFGGSKQQYTERYRAFHDAIKARHPDVTLIADTRIDAPIEVVDDHHYQSPAWFWANAQLYDRADRRGPKIYVGEYAVTQDCGLGNLRAALAEAAFMTGLLRNSDLVVMSSYAPLFVHLQDRKWNPDLIGFDGSRAFGTPSYHVQAMFAANRPDTLLPCEVPELRAAGGRGSIGLGTWNTHAEYQDVTVEQDGKVLYASDFAHGTDGWHFEAGDWTVHDQALRQGQDGDHRWCRLELPALQQARDYTLRCKARKLGGAEGFLLLFHVAGADDWTWFNVGGWGNREHALERCTGGGKSGLGGHVPGSIETGRWYDLRVECHGDRIRTFIDGKLVHDEDDQGPPTFAAAAGSSRQGDVVLFAVNGSDEARRMAIDLQGGGALQPTATATVLTSGSMLDENGLDAPLRVAPQQVPVEGIAPRFEFTFAPRSLTVLRLPRR